VREKVNKLSLMIADCSAHPQASGDYQKKKRGIREETQREVGHKGGSKRGREIAHCAVGTDIYASGNAVQVSLMYSREGNIRVGSVKPSERTYRHCS